MKALKRYPTWRVFVSLSVALLCAIVVVAIGLAGQVSVTPIPGASSVPVPVSVQTPVPVSFQLPFAFWIGLVGFISAGLVGLGVILRMFVKVSATVIFISTLRVRLVRIEKDLRKLKLHAGIDCSNEDEIPE